MEAATIYLSSLILREIQYLLLNSKKYTCVCMCVCVHILLQSLISEVHKNIFKEVKDEYNNKIY